MKRQNSKTLREAYNKKLLIKNSSQDTLHELYITRQINQLLTEQDSGKLDKAKKKITDELVSIRSKLKDVLSLGAIGGAVDEAIEKVELGDKKEVAKASTFIASLGSLFGSLPKILEDVPQDDTIDLQSKDPIFGQLGNLNDQKKVLDAVKKSLKPKTEGGLFSKILSFFFKGASIPYVNNADAALKELLENTPTNIVFGLSQSIPQKAQQASQEVVQSLSGSPEGGAQQSQQVDQQVASTKGTAITSPQQLVFTVAAAQAQTATKDPEKKADAVQAAVADAEKNPKTFADKFANQIASDSKVDIAKVKPIVKALVDTKSIHTSLTIQTEVARHYGRNSLGILLEAQEFSKNAIIKKIVNNEISNKKALDKIVQNSTKKLSDSDKKEIEAAWENKKSSAAAAQNKERQEREAARPAEGPAQPSQEELVKQIKELIASGKLDKSISDENADLNPLKDKFPKVDDPLLKAAVKNIRKQEKSNPQKGEEKEPSASGDSSTKEIEKVAQAAVNTAEKVVNLSPQDLTKNESYLKSLNSFQTSLSELLPIEKALYANNKAFSKALESHAEARANLAKESTELSQRADKLSVDEFRRIYKPLQDKYIKLVDEVKELIKKSIDSGIKRAEINKKGLEDIKNQHRETQAALAAAQEALKEKEASSAASADQISKLSDELKSNKEALSRAADALGVSKNELAAALKDKNAFAALLSSKAKKDPEIKKEIEDLVRDSEAQYKEIVDLAKKLADSKDALSKIASAAGLDQEDLLEPEKLQAALSRLSKDEKGQKVVNDAEATAEKEANVDDKTKGVVAKIRKKLPGNLEITDEEITRVIGAIPKFLFVEARVVQMNKFLSSII